MPSKPKKDKAKQARCRWCGKKILPALPDSTWTWIHAHTLRHSHAMHLREQGVHPFIMQEALGHATIGSTLVYSRVSDEDSARAKAQIRWS